SAGDRAGEPYPGSCPTFFILCKIRLVNHDSIQRLPQNLRKYESDELRVAREFPCWIRLRIDPQCRFVAGIGKVQLPDRPVKALVLDVQNASAVLRLNLGDLRPQPGHIGEKPSRPLAHVRELDSEQRR